MTIEFQPWPKIARLNRDITITEKIDGTNAAVVIVKRDDGDESDHPEPVWYNNDFVVFAQSRTRFITPKQDNYGFATWVRDNAEALVETLGEGTHFGEWWGAGIQRNYQVVGKRFSLFNTKRWASGEGSAALKNSGIPNLGVVPVLYEGPFSEYEIQMQLARLQRDGSMASIGFGHPEGIVIFHHASREMYKVTIEGDEAPKGPDGHRFDEQAAA